MLVNDYLQHVDSFDHNKEVIYGTVFSVVLAQQCHKVMDTDHLMWTITEQTFS